MSLTLASIFADLPDPRAETPNTRHRLSDILTIATCAVIAGAEGWEDIAAYGRAKEAFFRQFLPLDNGIPSNPRSTECSPDSTRTRSPTASPGGWPRSVGIPG